MENASSKSSSNDNDQKDIIETVDPNIIVGLMNNYKNTIEAILELVDNAVDDRLEGSLLKIEIFLGSNFIEIRNFGGRGMGREELENFLRWGYSLKKNKIGRYGQGGKAALGYLGRSWELTTSKQGEENTYIIQDYNWKSRRNGVKKYSPIIQKGIIPKTEGRVVLRVTNLSKRVDELKLKEKLSDYYRMLLEENKIEIKINNNKIEPLNIPLEYKEEFTEKIDDNKEFYGWIGILSPNVSNIRGGIRCCIFGRKIIDSEYFGHPNYTHKATLNRIIGEINANFLDTTLNKSNINFDCWEWKKVEEKMYKRMEPFINRLLREREEEQISEEEKKRHKKASEIWNQFMKEFLNKEKMLTEEITQKEFDFGQKPPESKGEIKISRKDFGDRDKYKPATPPPEVAIGKRKRLKKFLGIRAEPGIIPDTTIRSELQIRDQEEIIIINKKFPAYKKRKGDEFYIWETIAMECAKPEAGEDMDYSEYIKEFGKIFSSFCFYLKRNKILKI